MEEHNSDRYNEGHSYHNEIVGIREPKLGDYWRPLLNENYSWISHQSINANNFKLKTALISMVQRNSLGEIL